MIELSGNLSRIRNNITTGLYLSLGIVLAVTAWYHYLLGHYNQILWPALSSPLVFVLALIRVFQSKTSTDITPYPLLAIIGATLLNTSLVSDPLYLQWLYMVPVLTYFILPVRQASISLGVFFSLFMMLSIDQMGLFALGELTINLSLFSGISFIFAYTQESQTQTLERLSGKDSLTGAFSANQLNSRLIVEVSRAKATRRPLSALLFTLQNVEELTLPTSEHKGRSVLPKIAHIMRKISRTGDEIYRMSDNSFLLLLPNTSINGCIVLKERLVQQITDNIELASITQDLGLIPVTLQASEDARQFLDRALEGTTPLGQSSL